MVLSSRQLDFSIDSLGDPFGRVFFLNGRVLRMINNEHLDDCMSLLNSKMFKELENKGFIPKTTIATDVVIDGVGLILEHERVFNTRPHEWSFSMLKEVAAFALELNELCGKYGYELKDAHPHNFLFKDGHPIMIDIGSFQKKGDYWVAYEEFLYSIYLPLLLWSKGELYFERLIIESDNYHKRVYPFQEPKSNKYVQVCLKPITAYRITCIKHLYTSSFILVRLCEFLNYVCRQILRKPNFHLFKIEKKYLSISIGALRSIKAPAFKEERRLNCFFPSERIGLLFATYFSKAHSCLDVDCGNGEFIYLINRFLKCDPIIALDHSSDVIDEIRKRFKEDNSVEVMLSSIINPPDVQSFVSRVHCDLVLCHGAVEYYVNSGFLISTVIERLNQLSDRFIFIVFDSLGLSETPEKFDKLVNSYFHPLYVEHLDGSRLLFLGEKIGVGS